MNNQVTQIETHQKTTNWAEVARELAAEFGKRAVDYDESGEFVAENFADLREAGFFSAAIPAELGGGGASYSEICDVVREIGKHCGSTALTFAMHTHTVCANVFKYQRGEDAAGNILRKIAANNLIVSTTGANDWLQSSGTATKTEGGFQVNARKHFVSGCLGADVLVTSATMSGDDGDEVIHFSIPRKTEGVEIIQTWNTIGMRGTGSHDVVFNNVFVADSAVVGRRPAGQWHPMWEVVLPTAMPLISSAYVGLAEAAVCLAMESARRKGAYLAGVAGEVLNQLTTVKLALDDMVRINNDHGFTPGVGLVSDILTRKAIVAEGVKEVIETAAELVGGPGFYRGHAMERIVRDIRALHYHPLPLRRQQIFSGRLALGLSAVEMDPANLHH
jgi:acyl-CoA dehydrogenase